VYDDVTLCSGWGGEQLDVTQDNRHSGEDQESRRSGEVQDKQSLKREGGNKRGTFGWVQNETGLRSACMNRSCVCVCT
jgi:hypothetical protein